MASAARGRSSTSSAFYYAKVALQEGGFDRFSRLLNEFPGIATEQGGSGCNGRTLLHYACTLDAVMQGDRLFKIAYDVPPTDRYGGDVMYHPGVAAVQMLLENGAKVNARELDGATPLFVLANMMRRYSGHLSEALKGVVAQMRTALLQAGADPMFGESPEWSAMPRSPYSMAMPGSALRREYEGSPAMRAAPPAAGAAPMAAMTLPGAASSSAPPLARSLSGEADMAAQRASEQAAVGAMMAMAWSGRPAEGDAAVAAKAGGVVVEHAGP